MVVPSYNAISYPAQILFKDLSTPDQINIILDLAQTGLMPESMKSSGQDDTFTISLSLKEEIKNSFKFSALFAMQDFDTNAKIVGYKVRCL